MVSEQDTDICTQVRELTSNDHDNRHGSQRVERFSNWRPLVPVSKVKQDQVILTPATLHTQNIGPYSIPPGDRDRKDLHKRQWRHVQSHASTFWDRWHKQYLSTLQAQRQWTSSRSNIPPGTVVLMRDCQSKGHNWPLGAITPSQDCR